MLKIAVASENGMVTEHFGHCEGFMIFDTENNQIIKSETVANPGHRPNPLPVIDPAPIGPVPSLLGMFFTSL
jgi:hypothetical protein